MSSSSHPNAWQTAGRGGRQQSQQHHQPGSASRTPQNRSSNASPNQSQHSAPPPALPRQQQQPSQEARPPTSNAWTQRQTNNSHSNLASPPAANASNGAPQHLLDTSSVSVGLERAHMPLHGFNAAEVKAFLAREPAIVSHKSAAPSTTSTATTTTTTDVTNSSRGSGAAWEAKATPSMTSQAFFSQLAKQVATFEGGG